MSSVGAWSPVLDQIAIKFLDLVGSSDGWKTHESSQVLVVSNGRDLRTPEPRFSLADYPLRSVYALFPEHIHAKGTWWQLQDNVKAIVRGTVGYPCPILVTVFHSATSDVGAGASSVKIKPALTPQRTWLPASASVKIKPDVPPNPFRAAVNAWDEDEELKWYADAEADDQRLRLPVEAREVDAERPLAELLPEALEVKHEEPEAIAEVDWSSWDLGRSLRNLRTGNVPTIIKAIRQLHLRWWHAKADRMESLLKAAGLPPNVVEQIRPVVSTCRICRLWTRPSDRPQASLRLSMEFNQTVELDLLFIEGLTILHMIDQCIRWSTGMIIAGKTAAILCAAIVHCWFRIYGPPGCIVADHESALCSEEASIMFERWHVTFKPKGKGSHAAIVERHHEVLRQQFHLIKSQCQAEGLAVSDEEILSECFWAKNSMIRVHGQSPYQALFGRVPPLLQEFESPTISATLDSKGGENSRHVIRLREISLQSIVEGTAKERIKRASHTQTRVTGELLGLQAGDLVDVFRSPASKDNVGWRGPCTVISTANLADGYVDCRWGGRALSVRMPDLRRHLVYFELIEEDDSAMQLLRQTLRDQATNQLNVFSMILSAKGWVMSKSAIEFPHVFRAGLNAGHNVFNLRCIGVRLGHGCATLSALAGTSESVLLWYPQDSPSKYSTLSMNASQQLNLRQLFGDEWQNIHFMQFIGVSSSDADHVREVMPDEPMLGNDPMDVDRPIVQVPQYQPLLPIAEDMEVDPDGNQWPPPPGPPPAVPFAPPYAPNPVRSGSSVRSRSTRQPSRESSVDSMRSLPPAMPPPTPSDTTMRTTSTPVSSRSSSRRHSQE
jgi:hypothetical protein